MKARVLAVAAALAAGVSAGGHYAARRHAHEAFHLERGLLLTTGSTPEPTESCGCKTIWYTETGAPTLIGVAPKPSSTSSSSSSSSSESTSSSSTSIVTPSSSPAEVSTSSPVPTSEAPASTESTESTYVAPTPAPEMTTEPPAPETSSAAASPSSSSSSSGSGSSGSGSSGSDSGSGSSGSGSSGVGSSGDQWASTYTPYNPDTGGCLSAGQVLIDIALIALKGFSAVRLYSTDCNTLQHVGAACEISGLKMILGVYISDTGISGAQDQVSAITAWAKWELVELIVVGNEAIFNSYCSASELASFISSSKSSFSGAGYSGPCTTTEPLNILQGATAELCEVIDVVGCNIHPFFNSAVAAEDAGSFVSSQLAIVDGLCSGKTGINLETGWPKSGSCNGLACPGKSEQETAVMSIKAAAGGRSAMFSFSNDLWKPLGSYDCEQSWGMIDLFGSL